MRLGLACLILVTGCDLYFTGDDDPPCALADVAPAQLLRDPVTGLCHGFGSGGCPAECGPCEADIIAEPDWGSCNAGCEAFDSETCLDVPGCRAVFVSNVEDDGGFQFHECWSIAPSGPAPGSCAGLDAQECSRHDNCSAFYTAEDGILTFAECRVEPVQGCFGDDECGGNAHCSTSDGECLLPPGCEEGETCPGVCYGKCVSDGDVCSNVACGPGTHCEAQCLPCDGTNGPCDPFCSPVCVPDTDACAAVDCAPGFSCVETCQGDPNNPGCGICDATCVPVGTCESLQAEAECLGRNDCTTVYTGEDCTCYGNGTCDCEVLTYTRCEAK